MYDYKIDLSTYYPSNENKFNIYVDEMTNKVASNVSLPYVISMGIWKSSYTIYLENLSEGCGEIREIIVDGYTTTTTTLNFILTTTQYVPPTTLFTTTTTTTTTSTTITTITTQYVPPSTTTTTTRNDTTTTTIIPPTLPVGSRRWYNNPTSRTLSRNNCPSGCTAGSATYYVEYGKYFVDRLEGIDGQGDVDAIAIQDLDSNAQNYVNTNATCTNCPSTVFWNTQQVIIKTRNDCGVCEGTSVTYVIASNTYSSLIDVETANNIAISSNQENAQINANLNGLCINCPPVTKDLFISTGVGDCVFGISFVSVGAYNGVPFDGGNYEFWIDGESSSFGTSYGKFGLPNGIHTAYVKDSKGTTVSQTFNINCPVETTTTTTSPPCDCYRGIIRNVGEYFYTTCQGNGESGYISNRDDVFSICIDITQPYTNVDRLVKSGDCGCS